MKKDQLYKLITGEMRRQVKACRKELDELNKRILDKYQCDLEVTMTLTPRGNIPNFSGPKAA